MKLEQLRRDAQDIFQAGVKAVDPREAVLRECRLEGSILTVGSESFNLDSYEHIIVAGAGKASAFMARALEELLGDRISEGLVQVKYGHSVALERSTVLEAGHPVPDQAGQEGAERIGVLLDKAGKSDLVFVLISGGGSALLPSPIEGISLEDKQVTTQALLDSGADIKEINTLRKHISQLKGGRAAQLASPAIVLTLILSDVIGDDLESIASGPTVPDSTTFSDCGRIIDKYGLGDKIPTSVLDHIALGINGKVLETPKQGDPVFKGVHNWIVASNTLAVQAALDRAEALGYRGIILSTMVDGETRDVARVHAAVAREIRRTGNPIPPPACALTGGETTVTIRGRGRGGRNQEFALAAGIAIEGLEDVVILSGGTDGTDGPTEAAGAVADGTTLKRASSLGLDPESYLADNDSYHFFKPLGDLLITGPTGTNVMDLRIILVG